MIITYFTEAFNAGLGFSQNQWNLGRDFIVSQGTHVVINGLGNAVSLNPQPLVEPTLGHYSKTASGADSYHPVRRLFAIRSVYWQRRELTGHR